MNFSTLSLKNTQLFSTKEIAVLSEIKRKGTALPVMKYKSLCDNKLVTDSCCVCVVNKQEVESQEIP